MLYHTANAGAHVEDFRTAMATAVNIAMQNGTNEVLISVHGKTNLDGVVSEAIGDAAVKTLQKPRGIIQFEGVTIYLETERVKSNFHSGVMVATHPSTKYLAKLLSDRRPTDVIYVPWAPEELQEYLNNNQSTAI